MEGPDTESRLLGLQWERSPLFMSAACSAGADVRIPVVPAIMHALHAGDLDTTSFLARHALAYLPYYMYDHWDAGKIGYDQGGPPDGATYDIPGDLSYAFLGPDMQLKLTRCLCDLRKDMPCITVMAIGSKACVSIRGTATMNDWLRNISTSPFWTPDGFIREGVKAAGVDVDVQRTVGRLLTNFVRVLKGRGTATKYHYGFVHNGVYAFEVAKRYVAMLRGQGVAVDEVGFYGTSLGGATAMIAGHLMRAHELGVSMEPDLLRSVRTHGAALSASLQTPEPQAGGGDDGGEVGDMVEDDTAMFGALAPAGSDLDASMRQYLDATHALDARPAQGARINVGVFAPPNYATGYSDISFSARRLAQLGDEFTMRVSMNYRDTVIHMRLVNLPGFVYPFRYDVRSLEECDRRGIVSVADLDPCRAIFPTNVLSGEKRKFSHDVALTDSGDGRVVYWMVSFKQHYMMAPIDAIEASKAGGCRQRWFEAGLVYPGEHEPECRKLWRAIDALSKRYGTS